MDERKRAGPDSSIWMTVAQLAVIAVVWAVPAVLLAALVLGARTAELLAVRPEVAAIITVGSQDETIADSVVVKLVGSEERDVASSVEGVLVRHGDATPGTVFSDGQVVAQVGDRMLIANGGALPFHRDLGRSSAGEDVARLNEILAALDLPFEKSRNTSFTSRTALGVRQLNQRINAPTGEVFRFDSTVFVGPGGALVGFPASIGDTVQRGDAVAVVASAPSSVAFVLEQTRTRLRWESEHALVQAADGAEFTLQRGAGADELAAFGAFVVGHGRATTEQGADPDGAAESGLSFSRFRFSDPDAGTVALVPATSLHTSASGRTCVFAEGDGEGVAPVALSHTSQANKTGVVEVDPGLMGSRIVADVSRLSPEALGAC